MAEGRRGLLGFHPFIFWTETERGVQKGPAGGGTGRPGQRKRQMALKNLPQEGGACRGREGPAAGGRGRGAEGKVHMPRTFGEWKGAAGLVGAGNHSLLPDQRQATQFSTRHQGHLFMP